MLSCVYMVLLLGNMKRGACAHLMGCIEVTRIFVGKVGWYKVCHISPLNIHEGIFQNSIVGDCSCNCFRDCG